MRPSSMALTSLPPHIFSEIVRLCFSDKFVCVGLNLRLVDRAFNHEILFQCFIKQINVPGPVRGSCPAGVQFNNLIARRLLQGELRKVEFQGADCCEPRWAISMLEALRIMRAQSKLRVTAVSPQCPTKPSSTNEAGCLNGVFDDLTGVILCDAIVSYHSHYIVREAVKFPTLFTALESRSVACWLFLVGCFTGDLDLVQRTSEDVVQGEPNGRSFFSTSLHVASQEGHESIVSYLLDEGADINASGPYDQCALKSAVKMGHLDVVRLLLSPRYKLNRSGLPYEGALASVSNIVNQQTRLTAAQLLLAHGESLNMPKVGGALFYAACKFNDLELGALALDRAPIRVYNFRHLDDPHKNILQVAVERGHLESVQLILRSRGLFQPNETREPWFWVLGFHAMSTCNRLDMFREGIPFIDWTSPLLAGGAAIEGGVETVEKVQGLGDLNAACTHHVPGDEHTVGSQALKIAVEHGRAGNVRHLLGLGMRTDKEIAIRRSTFDANRSLYEEIQQILTGHGNPGIASS